MISICQDVGFADHSADAGFDLSCVAAAAAALLPGILTLLGIFPSDQIEFHQPCWDFDFWLLPCFPHCVWRFLPDLPLVHRWFLNYHWSHLPLHLTFRQDRIKEWT